MKASKVYLSLENAKVTEKLYSLLQSHFQHLHYNFINDTGCPEPPKKGIGVLDSV